MFDDRSWIWQSAVAVINIVVTSELLIGGPSLVLHEILSSCPHDNDKSWASALQWLLDVPRQHLLPISSVAFMTGMAWVFMSLLDYKAIENRLHGLCSPLDPQRSHRAWHIAWLNWDLLNWSQGHPVSPVLGRNLWEALCHLREAPATRLSSALTFWCVCSPELCGF
jgi:hypothetical protein